MIIAIEPDNQHYGDMITLLYTIWRVEGKDLPMTPLVRMNKTVYDNGHIFLLYPVGDNTQEIIKKVFQEA